MPIGRGLRDFVGFAMMCLDYIRKQTICWK